MSWCRWKNPLHPCPSWWELVSPALALNTPLTTGLQGLGCLWLYAKDQRLLPKHSNLTSLAALRWTSKTITSAVLLELAFPTKQYPCALIQTPPSCIRRSSLGLFISQWTSIRAILIHWKGFNPAELHKHPSGSETGVYNHTLLPGEHPRLLNWDHSSVTEKHQR